MRAEMWQILQRFPANMLIMAVRFYQVTLSPMLGPTCRFQPTCSAYFIEAVNKYGVIVGSAKGVWRILRCHPFNEGGHDPP
jgi:putative membrane protein insertion efficiency factor